MSKPSDKSQWTRVAEQFEQSGLTQKQFALRKAALGRKNFLFVCHEQAGDNLAGLYALVATCEVNGLNPELYLADVLLRVQSHPHSRIDELLPHLWKPLPTADSA